MLKPNFELTGEHITPQQFLDAELGWGISLENDEFVNVAFKTLQMLKPLQEDGITTCLDYGAGTGAYTLGAINNGFDTYTFEIWDAHKNYMRERIADIKIAEEPVQTDLMLFIEVAEHMTDKEIDEVFKKISPEYILFSSTSALTEWDVEWGHINIKEQNEWISFWNERGYYLAMNTNAPTPWAKLFKKI